MFLIQSYGGATIHAFTCRQARDAKIKELRAKYPRTPYEAMDLVKK